MVDNDTDGGGEATGSEPQAFPSVPRDPVTGGIVRPPTGGFTAGGGTPTAEQAVAAAELGRPLTEVEAEKISPVGAKSLTAQQKLIRQELRTVGKDVRLTERGNLEVLSASGASEGIIPRRTLSFAGGEGIVEANIVPELKSRRRRAFVAFRKQQKEERERRAASQLAREQAAGARGVEDVAGTGGITFGAVTIRPGDKKPRSVAEQEARERIRLGLERTRILEVSQQKRFGEGIERIEQISSFITGGRGRTGQRKTIPGRIAQAAASATLGAPFFTLRNVPIVSAKVIGLGEGLISSREIRRATIKDIKAATPLFVKAVPELVGVAASGIFAGSLLPRGRATTPKAKGPRTIDVPKKGFRIIGLEPVPKQFQIPKILVSKKGAFNIRTRPTPKKTLRQRKPTSKAELRKISQQRAFDPRTFIDPQRQLIGKRLRGPELKAEQLTKERIILESPEKVIQRDIITDIPLSRSELLRRGLFIKKQKEIPRPEVAPGAKEIITIKQPLFGVTKRITQKTTERIPRKIVGVEDILLGSKEKLRSDFDGPSQLGKPSQPKPSKLFPIDFGSQAIPKSKFPIDIIIGKPGKSVLLLTTKKIKIKTVEQALFPPKRKPSKRPERVLKFIEGKRTVLVPPKGQTDLSGLAKDFGFNLEALKREPVREAARVRGFRPGQRERILGRLSKRIQESRSRTAGEFILIGKPATPKQLPTLFKERGLGRGPFEGLGRTLSRKKTRLDQFLVTEETTLAGPPLPRAATLAPVAILTGERERVVQKESIIQLIRDKAAISQRPISRTRAAITPTQRTSPTQIVSPVQSIAAATVLSQAVAQDVALDTALDLKQITDTSLTSLTETGRTTRPRQPRRPQPRQPTRIFEPFADLLRPSRIRVRLPKRPPRRIPGKVKKGKTEKEKREELLGTIQAFIAEVKQRGRFVPVGPITTRRAALDIGARAVGTTLAATFRVRPVAGRARRVATTGAFRQLLPELRAFKRVKGRRVPLRDTFIQVRRARLTRRTERQAIQRARSASLLGGKPTNFLRTRRSR